MKPKTKKDWPLVIVWLRILRCGSRAAILKAIRAYEEAEAEYRGDRPMTQLRKPNRTL